MGISRCFLVGVFACSFSGWRLAAAARETKDRPPRDNTAIGKKYTLSAWPTLPRKGPPPDFAKLLTDGEY